MTISRAFTGVLAAAAVALGLAGAAAAAPLSRAASGWSITTPLVETVGHRGHGGHGHGGIHFGGGNFGGHGHFRGGHFRGFGPGIVLGAPYYRYGGYGPGYFDDGGYYADTYAEDDEDDDGADYADDPVARCQARYRSFDLESGTFLGYDGLRHPCPYLE